MVDLSDFFRVQIDIVLHFRHHGSQLLDAGCLLGGSLRLGLGADGNLFCSGAHLVRRRRNGFQCIGYPASRVEEPLLDGGEFSGVIMLEGKGKVSVRHLGQNSRYLGDVINIQP